MNTPFNQKKKTENPTHYWVIRPCKFSKGVRVSALFRQLNRKFFNRNCEKSMTSEWGTANNHRISIKITKTYIYAIKCKCPCCNQVLPAESDTKPASVFASVLWEDVLIALTLKIGQMFFQQLETDWRLRQLINKQVKHFDILEVRKIFHYIGIL